MSESCGHNCGSCGKDCESRDLHEKLREGSSVKKVIGIVSGKGGVGKSLVTSLLACRVNKDGFKSAILDADITGPSIPESFGVGQNRAESDGNSLNPVVTDSGIQLMSMNFLLENENDPVVWRGPVIAGAVKQFWTDVIWEDVDYLFVDMPPGTGDVPLTVFQSLPVDGVIIVTSPQDLVSMIVAKAVKMANMMHIPVLGFVENYSYLRCPDCGRKISVFGKSHLDEIAAQFNLPILARLPIDPAVAEAYDNGQMETVNTEALSAAVEAIEK